MVNIYINPTWLLKVLFKMLKTKRLEYLFIVYSFNVCETILFKLILYVLNNRQQTINFSNADIEFSITIIC